MSDALFPLDPAAPDAGRYLVSARKYRPQTFADLVAQEHVARTLQNAILSDRLAHAYLFSGPRGVGKTTAARLLAKAINCTTPLAQREGAEPCRQCTSCRDFEAGRSLNIIEIDAASNNKVEDIRDLRETVRVPPQGAKKKIYILDEVHMLSGGAFNALLKTLEEPPPYVLFIFATTEPHKVLPTILSRCQRFDFRRIAVPEIVESLREICAAEGFTADDESLMLIARRGDGALRDALSLFDQAVSLCGSDLRYADLAEALGVVDTDLFFEVTRRAAAQDRAGLLTLVERIVRRGYDLQEFVGGLAEHLRGLLAVAATGHADLLEATDAMKARYLADAALFAQPDLLRLLMLADEAEGAMKTSPQPRLKLELALLKMASLERVADLHALLGKLERLEAALTGGKLPNPATALPQPTPPPTAPPPAPAAPPTTLAEPPAPFRATPRPPDDDPPPFEPDEADLRRVDPVEALRFSRRPDDDAPDAPPPAPRPAPRTPTAPVAAPPALPPSPIGTDLFGAPALRKRPAGDGPGAALAPGEETPTDVAVASTPDPHFGVSLPRFRDAWKGLAARLESPRLKALLAHATPTAVVRGTVEIGTPDAFTAEQLGRELPLLTTHLRALLGDAPPPLRFAAVAPDTLPASPAAADPFEQIKRLRQEHPVVRHLFDRFGAEIVW